MGQLLHGQVDSHAIYFQVLPNNTQVKRKGAWIFMRFAQPHKNYQTYGSNYLLWFHGTIGGQCICVLVDDGSTHNFLKYTLIKKLGLPHVQSSHTYIMSLINGDDNNVWDKVVMTVKL